MRAFHRLPAAGPLTVGVVAVLSGQAALAGDLYVDGDRAPIVSAGVVATGGAGTALDPFWTLGQAAQVAKNGDVVHVAGVCREPVAFQGLSDIWVRQWTGRPQAQIRGDVPVPQGEWTWDQGSAYRAQFADDLPISSIIFNWDSTPALGGQARAGHLLPVSTVADCRATPNSWHWDDPTNRLYVNLAGDDPRVGGAVAWCRKGTGLGFFECVRPVAERLHVKLWPDSTPGAYGILFGTTSGARARDCAAWDCGYHSIGAAGLICQDARIERCEFRGQRSGTHAVLYGSFGPVSGRVTDCVFHLYGLLGRDGQPVFPDEGVSAVYTHTEGINGYIADVECRGCVAYGYPGHATTGGAFWYGSRTATVSAADEDDWRKYPVRFVECRALSSDRMYLIDLWGGTVPSDAAFVRCRLDFSGSYDSAPIFLLSGAVVHRLLFDHCVVFADTTGRAVGELINVSPGGRVIAHNSVFYNAATDAAGYTDRGIARLNGDAVLKARQSVFAMATPGPFVVQVFYNNRPPSDYDLKHCWYDGFSDDWFVRDHATVRTKEAYRAAVDGPAVGSAALYDISPAFISPGPPLWNFQGVGGGPLRTLQLYFPQPFLKHGVNKRPYDGHWGAYQYGWVMGVPGRP